MSESSTPTPAGDGVPPVPLDDVDLSILRLLSDNARLSQRQIAREIGMSPPSVGDRLARLEKSGVIRGYRVELDFGAVGYPLVAYVLIALQGAPEPELIDALRHLPEVEDVHIVTGPRDLLVAIRVRDHEHLRTVLLERIWTTPGVSRVETCISLGGMKPQVYNAKLLDAIAGTRE
jgi:Lrp/AsnC family transcriptional regulator, leucine-responsive regulatory protein